MTANMTCTASFATTPITPGKTNPGWSPLYDGSTGNFNFVVSAPTCLSNSYSTRYQYIFTYEALNLSNPDSISWVTTTNSFVYLAATEILIYARAQCYNSSTSVSGAWGAIGQSGLSFPTP
jgi:hypothetical protein